MKSIKISLTALAVVAIVGVSFAFKAAKYHPANLWYKSSLAGNPIKPAPDATSFNTGLAPTTIPTDFSTGYYTTNVVTGTTPTVQGFRPNVQ